MESVADEKRLRVGRRQPLVKVEGTQGCIEMIEQPRADGDSGLCLQIMKLGTDSVYWFAGGTGGYRSWISASPADSRLMVILINNSALEAESVINPTEPSKEPADPSLAEFAGDYETSVQGIHYHFEVRGSHLWLQITGQPSIELSRHPATKDRFEFKPVKAEIQFARRGGKIVSTTLFQEGIEVKAKKLSPRGK
jgi:hypothetical protein